MEDRELVAAIAAGDSAGLTALYDKYAASLHGYCRWMLRDPAKAADALREVFNLVAIQLGSLRDATVPAAKLVLLGVQPVIGDGEILRLTVRGGDFPPEVYLRESYVAR